jgi:hypothetical protein
MKAGHHACNGSGASLWHWFPTDFATRLPIGMRALGRKIAGFSVTAYAPPIIVPGKRL